VLARVPLPLRSLALQCMAFAGLAAIAPNVLEAGLWAWDQASQASERAAAAWAAAPPDCKNAIIFAGNTCLGYKPILFSPGFGPLALGWGWGLVGFLIGVMCGLHFWAFLDRLDRLVGRLDAAMRANRQDGAGAAPGLQQMPPWHGAVDLALGMATDANRRILLQRLRDEGEPALQFLAASTGVSRRRALETLLGAAVVQRHANEWQL
jgi:hypothetical protein